MGANNKYGHVLRLSNCSNNMTRLRGYPLDKCQASDWSVIKHDPMLASAMLVNGVKLVFRLNTMFVIHRTELMMLLSVSIFQNKTRPGCAVCVTLA